MPSSDLQSKQNLSMAHRRRWFCSSIGVIGIRGRPCHSPLRIRGHLIPFSSVGKDKFVQRAET